MNVYADNGATTIPSNIAISEMIRCSKEIYGNPSSIHSAGMKAKIELENARNKIASCIHADPEEIYFTSGGSESDNQAIISAAIYGVKNNKKHIVSSNIEHHAVLNTLKKLEEYGFEITLLKADNLGFIEPSDVEDAIRDDTCLVTIMYANNEIGTIEPINYIGKICKKNNILFHTDAVQAVGHIPINVKKDNIDMLSFSAHKFHGLKGSGVLYVKKGKPIYSLISGGKQENNKRAGTENVPNIVAMASALEESINNLKTKISYIESLRDYLINKLYKIVKKYKETNHGDVNGSLTNRLPGNINFYFPTISGESLLLLLDLKGICVSTGSACMSGDLNPSHVLTAIGLNKDLANSSIRITIDENNTKEEIDYIADNIDDTIKTMLSVQKEV